MSSDVKTGCINPSETHQVYYVLSGHLVPFPLGTSKIAYDWKGDLLYIRVWVEKGESPIFRVF